MSVTSEVHQVQVKMPRKCQNTSLELRTLVIHHYIKGKSLNTIADVLKLPRSTCQYIIRRYVQENRIKSIPQKGRPKKLSARNERYIVGKIGRNPRLSASKLATEVNAMWNKTVSAETIRRSLRKYGYHGRIARRKPFLSEQNRRKRYQFAMKYQAVPDSFWENVIFSDESKFNLFGGDGRQKVWRKPRMELDLKNLTTTVKYGGGGVMVWGCFSACGVGSLVFVDGRMNAEMYVNILRNNLLASAEKFGIADSFYYYQDNDPKHTALRTREWMLYNCPHVMPTPAQSPDCNPIEHLWDYLDTKIRESPVRDINQLKERLLAEWKKIPVEYCQKLVSSMPRRLAAVVKARGLHTKY